MFVRRRVQLSLVGEGMCGCAQAARCSTLHSQLEEGAGAGGRWLQVVGCGMWPLTPTWGAVILLAGHSAIITAAQAAELLRGHSVSR